MSEINIFSDNLVISDLVCKKFRDNSHECSVYKSIVERPGYSIYIFNSFVSENVNELDQQLINCLNLSKASYKSLFVFPFTNEINISKNILIWSREVLKRNDIISGILAIGDPILNHQIVNFGLLSNGEKGVFYPTDLNWVADKIISLTFSMQAYGQITALIGSKMGSENLNHANLDYDQLQICPTKLEIKVTDKVENVSIDNKLNIYEKNIIDRDTESSSLNYSNEQRFMYKSRLSDTAHENTPIKHNKLSLGKPKTLNKFRPFRLFDSKKINSFFITKLIVITLGVYIACPFVFNNLILISFKVLVQSYSTSNLQITKNFLNTLYFLSTSSYRFSDYNSRIKPLFRYFNLEATKSKNMSQLISAVYGINSTNMKILDTIKKNNSSNTDKNIWGEFREISVDIEYLYNYLGFIEADKETLDYIDDSKLFSKEIKEIRQSIKPIGELFENMSFMLGKNETRKYALIVENKDMLRPSGSEIQYVAIIKISGGKLNDMVVYGGDSPELRLSADTEAPGNFISYFGKDNWNIKQSNWYSDFSLSAQKVVWFLENSLDEKVDGVFAISDKTLSDLEKLINDNYDSFDFTGKAVSLRTENNDILKRFVKVISYMTEPDSYKDNNLLLEVYKLLKEKEIRVYFNNVLIENTLTKLNWSNKTNLPICNDKCFKDLIGEFEISRKTKNSNIIKEVDINISVEESVIKKRMTIYLKNPNDFKLDAIYRVIAPVESGFSPITIVSDQNKNQVNGLVSVVDGFKENEIPISLDKNQALGVSYYWEQPIDTSSFTSYKFKILKQPSEPQYVLDLSINLPKKEGLSFPDYYSLTEDGKLVYNTKLSSDFESEISWRQ